MSTPESFFVFRPHNFGFWPRYLVHMRPYLLFISGISALVGMAYVPAPPASLVLFASIPFFLSYGLGQALTDVYQLDTDAISSSYRPLVRGEVTTKDVFAVSIVGFVVACAVIATVNPWVIPLGLINVVGLILYTKFKRTWWGGPPWNAWIVALLPVMGFLAVAGPQSTSTLWSTSGLAAICAIFFAYANFVVGGYFKDISADRQTGYNTFVVVFGWLRGAIYSDLVAAAAAAAALVAILTAPIADSGVGGLAVWVAAVAVNLAAQVGLHSTRNESATHGPIANIVRAFILYSIAIVVTLQPAWMLALAAYYVIFELVLRMRPSRTQV